MPGAQLGAWSPARGLAQMRQANVYQPDFTRCQDAPSAKPGTRSFLPASPLLLSCLAWGWAEAQPGLGSSSLRRCQDGGQRCGRG